MTETWRDALIRAWRGVEDAEVERRRVTAAAMTAGLSSRAIGDVVGHSNSMVWRIAKGATPPKPDSETLLDSPSEAGDQEEGNG